MLLQPSVHIAKMGIKCILVYNLDNPKFKCIYIKQYTDTERQIERQRDRQIDRQIDRYIDIKIDREIKKAWFRY